jgi:hypothetical protein
MVWKPSPIDIDRIWRLQTVSVTVFRKKENHMELGIVGRKPYRHPPKIVPVPVRGAVLYRRLGSRDEYNFGAEKLSALRYQFDGHEENAASRRTSAR